MYAIKHYMHLHKQDCELFRMANSSDHVYMPFVYVCAPLCE